MLKIVPKFILSLAFLAVVLCSSNAYAQTEISNTGFTQGNIWFSQSKLVEGDKVKIFTALWNGDQDAISGTVTFYDKSVILGQKDFTLSPNELKQASIDWQVTAGDHSISAQIVNAKTLVGTKGETVYLSNNKTATSEYTVPKNPALIKVVEKTITKDALAVEVKKAGEFIKDNIPASVAEPVSQAADSVDAWRDSTASSIDTQKAEVSAEIKKLNEAPKTADSKDKSVTEKPFAYVKLFFLTLGSFIFGHKIIFYGLSISLLFILIRFIYRKIKNR